MARLMGWGEAEYRSAFFAYVCLLAADFHLEGERYEVGRDGGGSAPARAPRQREVHQVQRFHSR